LENLGLSAAPFEHGLALRLTRRHKDGVTVVCAHKPGLLNENGVMHGGVIASIADEAVWHALVHHYGGRRPCTTTELKINYLRPIPPGKVTARAFTMRAGKTLFVGRVDIYDHARKLAAVGIVSYILLDDRS
jgi:uncharacterized protein (TIGR00369 family)